MERLIRDINDGSRSAEITRTTDADGVLYFNAFDGEDYGLWKTDGTSFGTIQLSTFETRPVEDIGYVAVNDLLFFPNFEDETGTELWVSDGTEEGTEVVLDIFDEGSSSPQQLTQVGNELYFVADSEGDGVNELWKTDGTEEGTESVLDSAVSNLTSVKGTAYFTQDEFPGTLWKLNNRTGEAEEILENTGSDTIASLTEVDGSLYFVRNEFELWRVEDNSSFPENVEEFERPEDSEGIQDLIEVDDTLYFSFNDGEIGRELYKSNGTANNTGLVLDVSPDMRDAGTTINLSSELAGFTDVEGTLYFVADSDDDDNREVWTSEGTEESTQLVREFERDIFQPINVGGTAYFGVESGFNRYNVWRTDGTEEGTELATDITGRDYSRAEAANGDLYFPSDARFLNEVTGTELWTIDNTPDVSVLFNAQTFTHLYTTDETEISRLVEQPNYSGSVVAFNGADPLSGQPVYEFTNEDTGANLYTIDETEREEFADLSGFEAEGTAFYAYESKVDGTMPIYRFQNIDTDGHFLTASEEKRESLIENENFESNGVAFYAFPEIDLA